MLQTQRAAAGAAKSGTLLVIILSAVAENIFDRRNCSAGRLNLQGQMGGAGNPRLLCRRAAPFRCEIVGTPRVVC